MAKALQEEGFAVGRVKTRRLMKEAGGQVQRATRRAPVTTDSRHGYEVAPNLWHVTLMSRRPIPPGSAISPMCGQLRAGCMSPLCWIYIHAKWGEER